MKLRTGYLTWIRKRWYNAFLLKHIYDFKEALEILFVCSIAFTIAIPYLIVEGIVRFCYFIYIKQNDKKKNMEENK